MLEHLPRTVPADPGRPDLADDRRPIRAVTRQVAFEPGAWSPERAERVAELFDGLASSWHERPAAFRFEAVDDALARGGPFPAGPALEVGSGTGLVTPRLAARLTPLVSIDLSAGMLAAAPPDAIRLRADSSTLPIRDRAASVVALVNMFLFPAEVDRVLAPGGVLVWINTLGDATPIHLPATDVAAALPGDWDGLAADAGWGSWATFRRTSAG
jgi:SAM-dependent methyltransferase